MECWEIVVLGSGLEALVSQGMLGNRGVGFWVGRVGLTRNDGNPGVGFWVGRVGLTWNAGKSWCWVLCWKGWSPMECWEILELGSGY
ncbi:hypothetical protein FKM82_018541 [Ascaphus truei]